MSNLIRDMIEDNNDYNDVIPLNKMKTSILKLIIEFCEIFDYKNEQFLKKPILNLNIDQIYNNQRELQFF